MEVHHASVCRARSAQFFNGFGIAPASAAAPLSTTASALPVPERSLFMDQPLRDAHFATDVVYGTSSSYRTESHIYEEVGPPDLPPSLPPYYKKHTDPWCSCSQCYSDYVASRRNGGSGCGNGCPTGAAAAAAAAAAVDGSPPPYEAGGCCGGACCDECVRPVYSVVGQRRCGCGGGCRSASTNCGRQEALQRAAAAAAAYSSRLAGLRGQCSRLAYAVGALPPTPPSQPPPTRTRCPTCDAGYLGSTSDSRPPSAAACSSCPAAAAAAAAAEVAGTGAASPLASYSEKRGRGGGSGAWKATIRSLSPFPLLKRGSTCSSPTSSDGKRSSSERGSGCCSDGGPDRRRKLCCVVLAVAIALAFSALAAGLTISYAGRRQGVSSGGAETTRAFGTFRVTRGPYSQFSSELATNTSEKFSNWSAFVSAQIDYVLNQSNFSLIYAGSEVIRFRPGSVVVDFRLKFYRTSGESSAAVDPVSLRQALLRSATPAGSPGSSVVYLPGSTDRVIAIDAESVSFTVEVASETAITSDYSGGSVNSTRTTSQLPVASGACEPVRQSDCQRMYWNATGTTYPNFVGSTSQVGAERQVSILMLLAQRCYALWDVFVCAVYVPRCSSTTSAAAARVPPCRRLCNDALGGCKEWISSLQLDIPVNCSQFPDSTDPNVCVADNVPPCPSNTFRCDNTSCQPLRNKCDGATDCADGTDELDCTNFTCTSDQFRCANGNCRPFSWVCDKRNDCGDNSDEVNCQSSGKCAPNMFQCRKGGYSLWNETTNCILASYTCDKTNDCSDGSDEDPAYCHGRTG